MGTRGTTGTAGTRGTSPPPLPLVQGTLESRRNPDRFGRNLGWFPGNRDQVGGKPDGFPAHCVAPTQSGWIIGQSFSTFQQTIHPALWGDTLRSVALGGRDRSQDAKGRDGSMDTCRTVPTITERVGYGDALAAMGLPLKATKPHCGMCGSHSAQWCPSPSLLPPSLPPSPWLPTSLGILLIQRVWGT